MSLSFAKETTRIRHWSPIQNNKYQPDKHVYHLKPWKEACGSPVTLVTSNTPLACSILLSGSENSMTISLNLKLPTCTFSAKESNKLKEHPGSCGRIL